MKLAKRLTILGLAVMLAVSFAAIPAPAKEYKLTITAGHPPIFLWVTLFGDYLIPEVDKRLAEAGKGDTIKWNTAWGGTIAKLGGRTPGHRGGRLRRRLCRDHFPGPPDAVAQRDLHDPLWHG